MTAGFQVITTQMLIALLAFLDSMARLRDWRHVCNVRRERPLSIKHRLAALALPATLVLGASRLLALQAFTATETAIAVCVRRALNAQEDPIT